MLKTYQGSCHCGKVRFEADMDLAAGAGKCNCSICAKTRAWGVMVKPEAVRLVAGEAELSDYQFNTHRVHHLFCRHCGVWPFLSGHIEQLGGAFYAINLAALDNAAPEELVQAPVQFSDGRDNRWDRAPTETRHL